MKLSAWFPVTLAALSLIIIGVAQWLRPALEISALGLAVSIFGVVVGMVRHRRVRETIKLRVAMAEQHVAEWRRRFDEIKINDRPWPEMEKQIAELMAEDKKFWDSLPRLDVL